MRSSGGLLCILSIFSLFPARATADNCQPAEVLAGSLCPAGYTAIAQYDLSSTGGMGYGMLTCSSAMSAADAIFQSFTTNSANNCAAAVGALSNNGFSISDWQLGNIQEKYCPWRDSPPGPANATFTSSGATGFFLGLFDTGAGCFRMPVVGITPFPVPPTTASSHSGSFLCCAQIGAQGQGGGGGGGGLGGAPTVPNPPQGLTQLDCATGSPVPATSLPIVCDSDAQVGTDACLNVPGMPTLASFCATYPGSLVLDCGAGGAGCSYQNGTVVGGAQTLCPCEPGSAGFALLDGTCCDPNDPRTVMSPPPVIDPSNWTVSCHKRKGTSISMVVMCNLGAPPSP